MLFEIAISTESCSAARHGTFDVPEVLLAYVLTVSLD